MAPTLLSFVLVFFCYIHRGSQQKLDNTVMKLTAEDEENIRKATTIYDYHTRMSAYKDLVGSGCYIEFIRHGEPPLSQRIREFPLKKLPEALYISEEKLSKRRIWQLAGPRIWDFCRGFPTYLIQEVKNRDTNDIETTSNDISKSGFRRKRSSTHYFVGRLRGQTQSQYLNFGNSANGSGKAEAESTYGKSIATVVGTNGMGQAQSQSSPLDCAECYGPEKTSEFEPIKTPGYSNGGVWPGGNAPGFRPTIDSGKGKTATKQPGIGPDLTAERPGEGRTPGIVYPGRTNIPTSGYPERYPELPAGTQTQSKIDRVSPTDEIHRPSITGGPSGAGMYGSGHSRPGESGYTPGTIPFDPTQTGGKTTFIPGQEVKYPQGYPDKNQGYPSGVLEPSYMPSYPDAPGRGTATVPSYPSTSGGNAVYGQAYPGAVSQTYPGQQTYSNGKLPGYIYPDPGDYSRGHAHPGYQTPGDAGRTPGTGQIYVSGTDNTRGSPHPGFSEEKNRGGIDYPTGPAYPGYQIPNAGGRISGYGEVYPTVPTFQGQIPSTEGNQIGPYPSFPSTAQTVGQYGEGTHTGRFSGHFSGVFDINGHKTSQGTPSVVQPGPGYETPISPTGPPAQYQPDSGLYPTGRFQPGTSEGQEKPWIDRPPFKPGQYYPGAGSEGGQYEAGIGSRPSQFIQGGKSVFTHQPDGVGVHYPQQPDGSGRYPQTPSGISRYPQQQGETSAYPRQPGETVRYPQQPGETSSYPQKPGPSSRYPKQPGEFGTYPHQPVGPGTHVQQPDGRSTYPDQSRVPGTYQPAGGAGTYPPQPGGSIGYPEKPDGSSRYPEQTRGTIRYPQQPAGPTTYPQPHGGPDSHPDQPERPDTYPQQPGVSGLYPKKPDGIYPQPHGGPDSHPGQPERPDTYPQQPGGSGLYPKKPDGIYPPQSSGAGKYPLQPGEIGTYPRQPGGLETYPSQPRGSGTYSKQPDGRGTYYQQHGGSGAYPQQPSSPGIYAEHPRGPGAYPQQSGGPDTYPQKPSEHGTYSKQPGGSGLPINTYPQQPGIPGTYLEQPGGGVVTYPEQPSKTQIMIDGQDIPKPDGGYGKTPSQPESTSSGSSGRLDSKIESPYKPEAENQTSFNTYGIPGQLDDSDSQAQTSIQQHYNETQASAQAQGRFQSGTAQSQVSGTYTGSGSFSASAGSDDGNKGVLTQVSGGKQGATSNAQGHGGKGRSQAQMQFFSDTGKIMSSAQSGSSSYSTQTQVQGGEEGGMANAQSNGAGLTSSQAQIGFSPYKKDDKDVGNQQNPFLGSGMASAQGGSSFGQSESQIQGKFPYGIKYTGGAQAQSGSGQKKNFTFTPFNTSLQPPFNSLIPQTKLQSDKVIPDNGTNSSFAMKAQKGWPTITSDETAYKATTQTYLNNKDDDQDENEEYDYEENETEGSSTNRIITQTRDGQTQHIVLPNMRNLDANVVQTHSRSSNDRNLQPGEIFQPGEMIPGTLGYRIPPGFRGKIKAVASPSETYAVGKHSQAQSVTITPGTGKILYHKPKSHRSNANDYKSGYIYDGHQYNFRSGEAGMPGFLSISKSETGLDNPITGRKVYSTHYTQSSTCGFITHTCVFRNNQRICIPNIKRSADGSVKVC